MCGIVGYVGAQQAAPILLDGLRRLEYRGYDSAGMAVCGPEGLRVCKTKGRLQALAELTEEGRAVPGTLGVGHTRWATHGEPNDINAHPQVSENGLFAVVHNGIIENYALLRAQLTKKGYTFRSQTDTEVVAQLLAYYYAASHDLFEAVNSMLSAVEGAYALGIVCADAPDRLIAARKDAPLLLGCGDGENFLASDVTALLRHTRDIVYMDDGELAVITAGGIRIYDERRRPIEKEHQHIDWDVDAAEKGGYDHFMLKEIHEQPAAIARAITGRVQNGRVVLSDLTMTDREIRELGRICIVACGSSYHVGMVGKYTLERLLRRPVEVCLASEFRYSDPLVGEGDLVIVISQSGETLDSMAALREAKKRGVVMTIGSDSFSFVTPYGTCSIEEMYEFVDKIGFTPVETITCATLNGAKMCHIEDETGSIEAGKCADLLVVNGDVAADIHVLNTDNMDVIMKDGWIVEGGTFGEANKYSA